jgi:hypothetical protein
VEAKAAFVAQDFEFLTFLLDIRRRGALGCRGIDLFPAWRANKRKGKPIAATKEAGSAKNRPKTGGKRLAQIIELWNSGRKSRKTEWKLLFWKYSSMQHKSR